MNIVGLDGVVYGVEELDRCIEFWDDLGLNQTEANDDPALAPSPESFAEWALESDIDRYTRYKGIQTARG